jgi:hypothetical protein
MPKLLRSKLEGQWLITEKCVVDQGSIKEVVSATTHMIHRYYFLLRAILTTFFALGTSLALLARRGARSVSAVSNGRPVLMFVKCLCAAHVFLALDAWWCKQSLGFGSFLSLSFHLSVLPTLRYRDNTSLPVASHATTVVTLCIELYSTVAT